MKASPELREKMWELCYDLLPEGERSALIARIKSDPHAARLYAEVRLQADLVGYAAAVEDPSLNLSADPEKLKTLELAPAAGRRKEAAQPVASVGGKTSGGTASGGTTSARSRWAANALAIAAGLALVVLLGVGFLRPGDVAEQVAQLVVTEVEVPSRLTPGVTSRFAVRTASAKKQPVGVQVDVKVVDSSGLVVFHKMVATPADGEGLFEVPGEVIRPGSRLQVQALGKALDDSRGDERGEPTSFSEQEIAQKSEQDGLTSESLAANVVDTYLPVSQPEPVTYYVTDKPVAMEGEDLQVVGVAIDPFTNEAHTAPLDEIDVHDGETTRRMNPRWRLNRDKNLAEGTIRYGADSADRPFRMVDPQPLEQKKDAERDETRLALLKIERAKDAAEQEGYERFGLSLGMSDGLGGGRAGGINPGQTRSRFAAGVGNAKAGGELAALGPALPGASAAGAAAPAAAPATAPAAAAGVKSTAEADKAVAATPDLAPDAAKETLEKLAGQLADAQRKASEEEIAATQDRLAPTVLYAETAKQRRQIVETGKPLEVEVPLQQSGKRLEAIVSARGVEVIRQQVRPQPERRVAEDKSVQERAKVVLDVPPEVDGNVDLVLFDPVAKSVVLKRELYRQPARELRIEPINYKAAYEPGELVQLQVKVVNEQGAPASQTALVARIWNEDYVPDDRSQIVMLEDSVRRLESPDRLAELEKLAQRGRAGERENISDLKKAEEPAGGSRPGESESATTAASLATTTPQIATPQTATPAPPDSIPAAPLPEDPAPDGAVPGGAPRFARSDTQAVDALRAGIDAKGNLDTAGASTGDFALFGYMAGDLPPVRASNELAIRQHVDSLKSEDARALAAWRLMFGRVLIGGGLVALAMLGVLFVMQQEVRLSSGTLALVTSAACLVIGAFWSTGGRQDRMIAMAAGGNAQADAQSDFSTAATVETASTPSARAKSASPASGGAKLPESPLAEAMQELAPADSEAAPPSALPLPKEAAASPDATPSSGAPPQATPAPPADSIANNEPPASKAAATKFAGDDIPAPAGRGSLGGFGGGEGRDSGDRRAKALGTDESGGAEPSVGGFGSAGAGLGGKGRGGQSRSGQSAAEGDASNVPNVALAPATPATPPRPAPSFEPAPAAPTVPAAPATADRPSATRRAMQSAAVPERDAAAAAAAPPAPAAADPAAEPAKDESAKNESGRDKSAGAPSAIYFNPQLTTAADGTVIIEFRMPAVASEYRVLLDAYGNGRVGSSAELRIICQEAK